MWRLWLCSGHKREVTVTSVGHYEQQQTEAIQHFLHDAPTTAAPGARPQSAHRHGRPPASSRAAPPQAESTPRPVRQASRRRVAPPASQPGPKSSRKSTKRPWCGQPEDVGVCSFSGDGENSAAPSPGRGPGGESYVIFLFLFCRWTKVSQRKSNFLFLRVLRSMGRQCATPCFLTLAHDPSCQQPREYGSGTQYLPTHLWPVPFRRKRRLLYHPALLPFAAPQQVCRLRRWSRLHSVWRRGSRRPGRLSLAHVHNSTRLSDSVRQATSQVHQHFRDFGGSPERPCLARGDCCPPGKGCNQAGPFSRDEAGVS